MRSKRRVVGGALVVYWLYLFGAPAFMPFLREIPKSSGGTEEIRSGVYMFFGHVFFFFLSCEPIPTIGISFLVRLMGWGQNFNKKQ